MSKEKEGEEKPQTPVVPETPDPVKIFDGAIGKLHNLLKADIEGLDRKYDSRLKLLEERHKGPEVSIEIPEADAPHFFDALGDFLFGKEKKSDEK